MADTVRWLVRIEQDEYMEFDSDFRFIVLNGRSYNNWLEDGSVYCTYEFKRQADFLAHDGLPWIAEPGEVCDEVPGYFVHTDLIDYQDGSKAPHHYFQPPDTAVCPFALTGGNGLARVTQWHEADGFLEVPPGNYLDSYFHTTETQDKALEYWNTWHTTDHLQYQLIKVLTCEHCGEEREELEDSCGGFLGEDDLMNHLRYELNARRIEDYETEYH